MRLVTLLAPQRATHPDAFPDASRVAWRLRVAVRLQRARLDRTLVGHRPRLLTPALAVRARQLTAARHRARLARSLRRLVADAEDPLGDRYGVIAPGYGPTVRAWREGLLGIAERLEEPVPVSATAVARAVTLLTDGTSPLYCGGCRHSLADAIWWVADGFRDCPPHAWSCPVVMKVCPDQVAWSCSRCGAMAFSGDRDAPPS